MQQQEFRAKAKDTAMTVKNKREVMRAMLGIVPGLAMKKKNPKKKNYGFSSVLIVRFMD